MEVLRVLKKISAIVLAFTLIIGMFQGNQQVFAGEENQVIQNGNKIQMKNDYFDVTVGEFGQIESLYLVGDLFPTNYVMNAQNSSGQNTEGHQWLGELMFKTKLGQDSAWVEELTQSSTTGRKIEIVDNKVVVTYEGSTEDLGIKQFKLIETYSLVEEQLHWEITIENNKEEQLVVGDLGLPLPFNERWPGGEEIYETRTVDHSFVGKDSSYIYVTRPSGKGKFLLMTPDVLTGAGFEYQDHWRLEERRPEEASWCQDQAGWPSGLNVFYIHSDVIKSTNRGYLENTFLTLNPGESKTYAFNFNGVQHEEDMKSTLYQQGIVDAVAVPGMTFARNMPAKLALHAQYDASEFDFEIQCPHELDLHNGNPLTVSNLLPCEKTAANTYVNYVETKVINNENYHIYDIRFQDLGQNNVVVKYAGKETVLQFYMMDDVEAALEVHSDFMVEKTQWDAPGTFYDKVFDDWMMDTTSKRGEFKGYWGWGDDWGLTHGQFLAEKNVYIPVATQIQAVDEYLDVAIWNSLMREHQEDYKIHDFLMAEPNDTPLYRGYAYPHIYNTYYSMYKIAKKYPDMIEYCESADTYLLRAYNILTALYSDGVAYNWNTGVMGELTTPQIIDSLEVEGYYEEAQSIRDIMATKYDNFKNTKYPYGSEYSYDNTGEEAVYTLAKVNLDSDLANANRMMESINEKTRACRGLGPIWYHYANPTTICGESWWNFQYTAALAGYCMDDWLRLQDNQMNATQVAVAARMNYAAKLANLTSINSGQIDANPENIGTVSWTYQSEMGNLGAQGTGGGNLHNGWRQMAGEADLGLFGALNILSSDVSVDPIFGLFGYGCEVRENGNFYEVTPLDGLYTRLNFLNEKLYMELKRDQYDYAVVSKNRDYVELTLHNLEKSEHTSDLEMIGLVEGSYQIEVDGQVIGSFKAVDGEKSVAKVKLGTNEFSKVIVRSGLSLENQEPIVDAGEDAQTNVSDGYRLKAEANDDGYPTTNLSATWELVDASQVSKVIVSASNQLITDVKFLEAGTYEFKITVSDSEFIAADFVIIEVLADPEIPEVLASYDFSTVNNEENLLLDISGLGIDSRLVGYPQLIQGLDNTCLSMNGKVGGYVRLSNQLTHNIEEATIVVDFQLDKVQGNGARLFEFGDMDENYLYLSFEGNNNLCLYVTDLTTKKLKKVNSELNLASGYRKNVVVTIKENLITLYVDGKERGSIADSGFSLGKLGEVQRNYLGRSYNEKVSFFSGLMDNFSMYSRAMESDEIKGNYGQPDPTLLSLKDQTVAVPIGTIPVLPEKVKGVFTDGTIQDVEVNWEDISQISFDQEGEVFVKGQVITGEEVKCRVLVIAGTINNIAKTATITAIVNTPNDLGGVATLNDGYEPASSGDTTHGAWHNWGGGAQGDEAWIAYTWNEAQVITSTDVYFFKDGNGNFAPASATYQYMNEDGVYVDFSGVNGLGVKVNEFNHTSFDPVLTRSIRMTLNPANLGCGVIEWKVNGYSKVVTTDKTHLIQMVDKASAFKETFFDQGWDLFQTSLTEAKTILADVNASQSMIDETIKKLTEKIYKLHCIDNNIAYFANVAVSYISPWEKISAIQDGIFGEHSRVEGINHYGTWGHESTEEYLVYSWEIPMDITESQLYLWTNVGDDEDGGIKPPVSYQYEYMDATGNWLLMVCKNEPEVKLDQFNVTAFETVTTKAIRVTMKKRETPDSNEGLGLVEWRVIGTIKSTPVDPDPTPDPTPTPDPDPTPTPIPNPPTIPVNTDINDETTPEELITWKLINSQIVFAKPVISVQITKSMLEGVASRWIEIPYELKSDDMEAGILIRQVVDGKELRLMSKSYYDKSKKSVFFLADQVGEYEIHSNIVSFDDVEENSWYFDAISFLAARNISDGIGNHLYGPNQGLTRGQFLVLLMRALEFVPNKSYSDNFEDAGTKEYYTNYLGMAKELGITNGIDGKRFMPKQVITREEMMTLLYRILSIREELGQNEVNISGEYQDIEQVAPWALEATNYLISHGVIQGSGQSIMPKEVATRAQIAQILYNLLRRN